MISYLGGCSAAIGSVTQAMNAQRILGEAAIPTTVIKYENTHKTSRGCVYGISFSCAQINNVRSVLSRENVRVKQWTQEN